MTLFIMTSLLALGPSTQQPSERPLPFSDKAWELRGERTAVERDGDRDVLRTESGFAYRRDVQLLDGTIDFDVQVTTRRSFVYVMFRMADDREFEEMYLRPHKSGLPDALQYAPVWQRQSAWQLHHGPGGTAPVEFQPGVWTHVRLVLQGRRAALFVGDMARPALLVPRLAREPRAGYLALRGFLPAGVPGDGPIARFADVVVRPGVVAFDFGAETPQPPAAAGVVRAWAVSRSFVPKEAAETALPAAAELGEMRPLEAEPNGLLALHRFVSLPDGSSAGTALARIRVRASRAGTYAFDLGFSDTATVFVNGRPVFRGEGSYSFDAPRREGLIGFDQARLFLALAAGDNDVAVLVSDRFGGWGLMGRFPSPDGLQVDAR
jgi:hypothetical protein